MCNRCLVTLAEEHKGGAFLKFAQLTNKAHLAGDRLSAHCQQLLCSGPESFNSVTPCFTSGTFHRTHVPIMRGQVEVVTPLPPGGALVVRSPSGFAFMAPCSPQAAGQPGL